ncbi:hypothetical protein [Nocardia sp. MW-W600-9]
MDLVDNSSTSHCSAAARSTVPDVGASMRVVRHYDDPDGVHGTPGDTMCADVHKWPRPLGWHLTTAVLEFLVATGAELDVDEYH